MDYELVDEFVKEQEAFKQRKARRKAILTFAPVAACFVILLSIGTASLGYTFGSNKVYDENTEEQLKVLFEKEGRFVFEYDFDSGSLKYAGMISQSSHVWKIIIQ